VKDGIAVAGDRALEGGRVVERPLGEVDAADAQARHVRRLAVESDDVPVGVEERIDDVQTEETGGAGDERDAGRHGGRREEAAEGVNWIDFDRSKSEELDGEDLKRRSRWRLS
jgi:hypothetical protein